MFIFLVGDACSGKSSVLTELKRKNYPVIFENGWTKIPSAVEVNKFKGNLWFQHYYFEREKKIKTKDAIIEHPLCSMYAFTMAQYLVKKITKKEKTLALENLTKLLSKLRGCSNVVVIHFVCNTNLISARLKKRGRPQTRVNIKYRLILRKMTEKYFKVRTKNYFKIDTSKSDLNDVLVRTERILKNVGLNKEK